MRDIDRCAVLELNQVGVPEARAERPGPAGRDGTAIARRLDRKGAIVVLPPRVFVQRRSPLGLMRRT
jgi:hypothetical protein